MSLYWETPTQILSKVVSGITEGFRRICFRKSTNEENLLYKKINLLSVSTCMLNKVPCKYGGCDLTGKYFLNNTRHYQSCMLRGDIRATTSADDVLTRPNNLSHVCAREKGPELALSEQFTIPPSEYLSFGRYSGTDSHIFEKDRN